MSAIIMDILIEQGATFQREFTVKSRGQDLPNFTNYEARAMLRSNAGVLATSFAASITDSHTVLIELNAATTSALPASSVPTFKYDVEVKDWRGIVYRIAQGRATVSEEQTKGE